MAADAVDSWPLFGLEVRTPRLRLRYADDELLAELATFRRRGVARPGYEWIDGESSYYLAGAAAERMAVTGEWRARARISPEWWHLSFAVLVDDDVVGQQNITAETFKLLRTVNSFSALLFEHHGKGIGKEMRSAVLHLAFAGLGAQRAESDAFVDNLESIGVSRSLGYEENGTTMATRPSGGELLQRFLMTREAWEQRRRDDIDIVGLDACLPVLGLDEV